MKDLQLSIGIRVKDHLSRGMGKAGWARIACGTFFMLLHPLIGRAVPSHVLWLASVPSSHVV